MVKRAAYLLVAALLLSAVPVAAGVVAEVDKNGEYLRTLVFTQSSVKHFRIWNVKRLRTDYVPLNPAGDANGDLYPAILEDPSRNLRPWVVWSRYNGVDYDLAYSRWIDGLGWTSIGDVESSPGLGDDVDPAMAFDADSRPTAVWWTEESGIGQVFFTMRVGDGWMARYRVSDPLVDSRYPQIELQPDGSLRVDFLTPAGLEARTLFVHEGVSINDDSDPIFNITMTELQLNP